MTANIRYGDWSVLNIWRAVSEIIATYFTLFVGERHFYQFLSSWLCLLHTSAQHQTLLLLKHSHLDKNGWLKHKKICSFHLFIFYLQSKHILLKQKHYWKTINNFSTQMMMSLFLNSSYLLQTSEAENLVLLSYLQCVQLCNVWWSPAGGDHVQCDNDTDWWAGVVETSWDEKVCERCGGDQGEQGVWISLLQWAWQWAVMLGQ